VKRRKARHIEIDRQTDRIPVFSDLNLFTGGSEQGAMRQWVLQARRGLFALRRIYRRRQQWNPEAAEFRNRQTITDQFNAISGEKPWQKEREKGPALNGR
jgi:hypothetical protein